MRHVRKHYTKGSVGFGGLQSYYSFSFSSYYAPEPMGVSDAVVLNDGTVATGQGFPTHGHRNREIFSFVIQGSIEHQDSMGHTKRLPAGEFQMTSAGKGVRHSKYNPGPDETLKFWMG